MEGLEKEVDGGVGRDRNAGGWVLIVSGAKEEGTIMVGCWVDREEEGVMVVIERDADGCYIGMRVFQGGWGTAIE